jgi:glyoxylase-like metal-dependent hydrolase (beta-lactamase superfamily II)
MFDDREVVLVDAGSGRFVAAGLRSLGCSTIDIRLVVLTYYHPDHSGGFRSLLQRSQVSIAALAEEVPVIGGEVSHLNPNRKPTGLASAAWAENGPELIPTT